MGLKKSFYNIELDKLENGDMLIFNSYSTSFGIMNNDTQEKYYNIENIDESSIEDNEIKKNIEIMKANGFLVDSNINEYGRIKVLGDINRYNTKRLQLTIAPTINCNMACPYCYEEKTNKRMNEETQKALVEFVKYHITENNIKSLSIVWYGGEPLLEKETIKNLSKEFIDICKEKEVNYTASIVTNGALLDLDTAKMLKEECNVTSAQITIDGLKEIHNQRRILKNGQDSFEIVTNNIDACKEVLRISIRVNVDKTNSQQVKGILDYFIDQRNWKDKVFYYFAPVDKQTDACNADINQCYSSKEFGKLDTEILKVLYSKGNMSVISALYPKMKTISCGAVTTSAYVVDPEGELYKCWDLVGMKKHSVGNIKNGIKLNEEYLNWLNLDLPQECKDCVMVPMCQGGCPHVRLRNGNKAVCHHSTVSFKENLKITYTEYTKNKENKDEAVTA